MTHRHRHPRTPHPFIPSPERDWSGEHRYCDRCGFPRQHAVHTDYIAPEGDRSADIVGDREVSDDAA